ncbi:hypothetical protein JX266_014552, partial [Neoarthrinium moseri]
MLPGNNTLNFSGELFLHTIVQNFGKVLKAQLAALNDGQIQFDATGNATTFNGQRIPYIESVLNTKRLTAYVPVITFLSDLINGFIGHSNKSVVDVVGQVFNNKTL